MCLMDSDDGNIVQDPDFGINYIKFQWFLNIYVRSATFTYIYIFIMKLPLYIGGANRRGVGGASNYSY